jgi:hypothetical protein
MRRSLEEITFSYWEGHRLMKGNRQQRLKVDELWWAWDAIQQQVERGEPEVVDLLLALADTADGEDELRALGAGWIEDLLADHGRAMATDAGRPLLEALAEASRQNPRFRVALGSVYYDEDEVPVEVRAKLPGLPKAKGLTD